MNNNYNRMLRQLQTLSNRLQTILHTQLDEDRAEAQAIASKIRNLISQLKSAFSRRQLRRVLGGVAFLFGLSNAAQAQSFAPPLTNPFGLSACTYLAAPTFVDIDNDGDLDLFVGEFGNIKYFQNTGTANNPQFAAPISSPFGLSTTSDYVFLAFGDMDNDGDLDAFMGEFDGLIKYYQNTGTATNPLFGTPINNPFGLAAGEYIAAPTLADIDNDGDLDMLLGDFDSYYGNNDPLRFYRNTGTASSPAFLMVPATNPFANITVNSLATPHLVDLDGDGDYDLLFGEYYGDLKYHQNTGTATNPIFSSVAQTNPFGLQAGYYVAFIASGDLDNDGDIDLLIGEYYGNMNYYRNTTINIGLDDLTTFDFRLYPNPAADLVRIETGRDALAFAEILDINGRVMLTTDYLRDGIDISDLAAGVYLVKLTNQRGENVIKRLVKQ